MNKIYIRTMAIEKIKTKTEKFGYRLLQGQFTKAPFIFTKKEVPMNKPIIVAINPNKEYINFNYVGEPKEFKDDEKTF